MGVYTKLIQIDVLEDRINQLKQELLQIVKATGLNSNEAICCSRELDKLITIYQKYSHKRKKLETCS